MKTTRRISDKEMSEMLRIYGRSVRIIAALYYKKTPASISFDDVYAAAIEGLWKAVRDKKQKVSLTNCYVNKKIHGAIKDWLRSLMLVKRSQLKKGVQPVLSFSLPDDLVDERTHVEDNIPIHDLDAIDISILEHLIIRESSVCSVGRMNNISDDGVVRRRNKILSQMKNYYMMVGK